MSDKNFSSVQLLCGFNGADAATAFTDESSAARVATFSGNAQLDTAIKKWGTAALLLDGNGDFLTFPDSSAWDLTNVDFTVEGWFYATNLTNEAYKGMFCQRLNTSQISWIMAQTSAGNLEFLYSTDGTVAGTLTASWSAAGAFTLNAWHHVAVSRIGANLRGFLDGNQLGSTHNIGTTSIFSSNQPLSVGRAAVGQYYWSGSMDDLRITNGVGRYAANFRPPRGPFDRAKHAGVSGDRRAIVQLLHG